MGGAAALAARPHDRRDRVRAVDLERHRSQPYGIAGAQAATHGPRSGNQLLQRPGGRPSVRARRSVAAVTALSVLATLMVIFVPELHFAYRLPGLRISLETSVGLIALLAAFLVLGRLRQSGRLDDLVLACAFAVIAASTLFFKAVPSAFGRASEAVPVWAG